VIRDAAARGGQIDAIIEVVRLPDRQLEVTYRTARPGRWRPEPAGGLRRAVARDPRLDELLPRADSSGRSRRRRSARSSLIAPTEGGRQVDAVVVASRGFLGTVFIILMFITILIYGMWVATGWRPRRAAA
jgi:hypothetical protein